MGHSWFTSTALQLSRAFLVGSMRLVRSWGEEGASQQDMAFSLGKTRYFWERARSTGPYFRGRQQGILGRSEPGSNREILKRFFVEKAPKNPLMGGSFSGLGAATAVHTSMLRLAAI